MTRRRTRTQTLEASEQQQAESVDQQADSAERPHIWGWCNDGFHEGGTYRWGTPCPGGTDQQRPCACSCHGVASRC